MKSLGSGSSNPTQTPLEHGSRRIPQRDGEPEPNDYEHLRKLDYWAALNALRDEKKQLEDE